MNKPVVRVLVLVVLGAAAVVGAVAYKSGQTRALESRTRGEAEAVVRTMPSYGMHGAYLDGLFATVHPGAWSAHFKSEMVFGGAVNASAYSRNVLGRVMERLTADGQTNLRRELEFAMLKAGLGDGTAGGEWEDDAEGTGGGR